MHTPIQYSLIIIFIYCCLQEGMIFGKLRWWMDEYIETEWIRKPLYDCLICMSGLWTVVLWLLDARELSVELIYTIAMVGGLNAVLSAFVEATIFNFHRDITKE